MTSLLGRGLGLPHDTCSLAVLVDSAAEPLVARLFDIPLVPHP